MIKMKYVGEKNLEIIIQVQIDVLYKTFGKDTECRIQYTNEYLGYYSLFGYICTSKCTTHLKIILTTLKSTIGLVLNGRKLTKHNICIHPPYGRIYIYIYVCVYS